MRVENAVQVNIIKQKGKMGTGCFGGIRQNWRKTENKGKEPWIRLPI